jgi:alanyl-tRNA synthetase
MDTLYELLKENSELYKIFLDLEYKKYDAVIKNDIKALDDIVSKEQAYYLKIRGIEQKREKLMDSLGMTGKTLKEIIDSTGNHILEDQYEELNNTITELKKINSLLKTLIKVRLNRIDKKMISLGEKENTYSNGKNNSIQKSLLISHKI